ncbi:MAG: twin-arginine translocation signal domain-containing protein, partial [Halovenus sp.]
MTDRLSRRSLLATLGAGTVALAGCSSLTTDGGQQVSQGEIEESMFVGDDPPTDEPTNAPPFGD